MKTAQALYGLSAMKRGRRWQALALHSPQDKMVRIALQLVLIGIFALTAGCSLLNTGGRDAGKPSAESRLVDEQIQLERFADDFFARGGQGLDQSAKRLGTDEGRQQVLQIKLLLGSSVLSIVSGPNPNANLLDLVSVTVLTRLSVQDYWMETTNGAAYQPWLDASRVLETNAWELAARFLQPAQVAELRAGIMEWYAHTPELRTAFFARPLAFAHMVETTHEKEASKTSVFSLVNLAPAVAEVTQTRLFAERAMYVTQRMPFFLRLQGEQFAYEVTDQPVFRQALTNSTQVSESVASVSRTISQLPDRMDAERKEILADMKSQQVKLQDLTAEMDRTLVSGEKMAGSVTVTITNFDQLMKRFGVGEPGTNVSKARPFNILEYAQTADAISAMAQNLNTAIGSLNQSDTGIKRLSLQVTSDLGKVEDRGFRIGLMLIAALLIGEVLAGLVYRLLTEKFRRRGGSG